MLCWKKEGNMKKIFHLLFIYPEDKNFPQYVCCTYTYKCFKSVLRGNGRDGALLQLYYEKTLWVIVQDLSYFLSRSTFASLWDRIQRPKIIYNLKKNHQDLFIIICKWWKKEIFQKNNTGKKCFEHFFRHNITRRMQKTL